MRRGWGGGLGEQKARPRVLSIPGRKVCAAGRGHAPRWDLVLFLACVICSLLAPPPPRKRQGVVPAALAAPQAPPLLWARVHTARRRREPPQRWPGARCEFPVLSRGGSSSSGFFSIAKVRPWELDAGATGFAATGFCWPALPSSSWPRVT